MPSLFENANHESNDTAMTIQQSTDATQICLNNQSSSMLSDTFRRFTSPGDIDISRCSYEPSQYIQFTQWGSIYMFFVVGSIIVSTAGYSYYQRSSRQKKKYQNSLSQFPLLPQPQKGNTKRDDESGMDSPEIVADVHRSRSERDKKNKVEFLNRVGLDVYGYTSTPGGFIDDWRDKEFPYLIAPISIDAEQSIKNGFASSSLDANEREVYLDYSGSALPTQSQIQEIVSLTTTQSLGNPHSMGPAASRTKQLIEQATKRILDHFQAHPGKYYGIGNDTKSESTNNTDYHPGYEVVFTSGTTDAMRIIAERFPWNLSHRSAGKVTTSPLFVYAQNSHTSVVGMREVALQQNQSAQIVCQPIDQLIEAILRYQTHSSLEDYFYKSSVHSNSGGGTRNDGICNECRNCVNHLLVVPMECNFGGDRPNVKVALEKLHDMNVSTKEFILCRVCKRKHHQRWYTMLDIAKAASTSPVDLCQMNPDFACVSFYKLFGEPTGLGCLFVKRTAIDVLFPPNIDDTDALLSLSYSNRRRNYIGGGSVNAIVPGQDFTVPRSEPTPLASFTSGTSHFRGIVALLAGFNELHCWGHGTNLPTYTMFGARIGSMPTNPETQQWSYGI
jgi:selenocysteine lyase/cysteine desulfurase